MIDFPASPINGQVFTSGNSSWVYDGTKWVAGGASTVFMPPLSTGDNRICNGDMRIDQRNNGVGVIPIVSGGFVADRWKFLGTKAGQFQGQGKIPGSPSLTAMGFGYASSLISISTFVPTATDYFLLEQLIEADMVSDFAWGTANAQPVTLSFLVNSSLTGTFSGSIANDTVNRSYPFIYSIPTAFSWTKIVVTIPGDTTGAWVLAGNGIAVIVRFDLGSGTSFRAPAGAWSSGNYVGANSAVSVCATTNAQFNITGVKLEIGSVATPFNRQSLAKSMADCQRYFYQGQPPLRGNVLSIAGTVGRMGARHPVTMRAVPTLTMPSPLPIYDGATTTTVTSITTNYSTVDVIELDANVASTALVAGRMAAVYQGVGGNLQVSAEL